jgi:hypothetical protein
MYVLKYEIVIASLIKIRVFWDVTLCISAESSVAICKFVRTVLLGDGGTEVFRT